MRIQQIIEELKLDILTDPALIKEQAIQTGYASDMLSCVMAAAKDRSLWVTLQSHLNIVAVATLLNLSAIIITEGNIPEPAVIEKANQENVILLATQQNTFATVGELWQFGIRS
jgi:hypothetical protein